MHAVYVRLGEKRILQAAIERVEATIKTLEARRGVLTERKRKSSPLQEKTVAKRVRHGADCDQ
jgi:hypothetical protein